MIAKKASDTELLSQYRQGNEGAFEVLVHRYKSRIFTAIHLIVKDRYVAEDLLQETFIKAVRTIQEGRYNEEGKFFPWLSRIAHNMAIDHFRRNRRYPHIILKDGSSVFNSMKFSDGSAETAQVAMEDKSWVRRCVQELPQEQREVVILRHYFELSFQEIADRTGVSINTALGRMRYALINMRKRMIKTEQAYDKNLYTQRPDEVYLPRDHGGGEHGN
ncbi:MAG: RNA polymerase sigma factor [Bacteroidota bacterium]